MGTQARVAPGAGPQPPISTPQQRSFSPEGLVDPYYVDGL